MAPATSCNSGAPLNDKHDTDTGARRLWLPMIGLNRGIGPLEYACVNAA
jgi:hypothetical protein